MIDLREKEWADLREDFAEAAEGVLREMQHDGAADGEITVKVKISLVSAELVEDPTDETGEAVPAYSAEIGYEIKGATKKQRQKVTGKVGIPGKPQTTIVIGKGAVGLYDGDGQMEMIREDEA